MKNVLMACGRALPLARPLLMGVVNATPDSFSDGGEAETPALAAAKAAALVAAGADIIDLGGESTRPGAPPVPPDEESARLLPALEAVRRAVAVPISIDTRRASVAARALDLGAEIINDVSALADPDMARVVAERAAAVVLMHGYREHAAGRAVGRVPDDAPCIVEDVARFLEERIAFALANGIGYDRIVIDPGLGFGKTNDESVAILRGTGALLRLDAPILIGPSRKRFLAALDEATDARDRDEASLVAARMAVARGAAIVRLHKITPLW